MTITFPAIQPSYGTKKTNKPKIRRIALGDGYEFRAITGLPLNQDPKEYDLVFNLSIIEAQQLRAFFRERVADQKSFTFTPPQEGFVKQGTYSNSSGNCNVTLTNHGLGFGDIIGAVFSGSSSTFNGNYIVGQIINLNSFKFAKHVSAPNGDSGTVQITLSGAGQFVCDGWAETIPFKDRIIFNCKFREVFKP